jgi:hypothetical protein
MAERGWNLFSCFNLSNLSFLHLKATVLTSDVQHKIIGKKSIAKKKKKNYWYLPKLLRIAYSPNHWVTCYYLLQTY